MSRPINIQTLADSALLRLVSQGDGAAFGALYARHKDYVMRLGVRFTGDPEAAADVVQETFIYLMKKAPTLELTAKLTTYLYPVVKNLSLTAKRKDRVRHRLVRDDGADIDVPAAPAQESRDPDTLASVIGALPEHQREVLLMRFVDDMSMEQIGTALSIPVGTVKSRLHLAIKTLRADPGTAAFFGESSSESASGSG